MRARIRRLVKKLFTCFGLRVRRVHPADDNYLWLDRFEINTVIDVGANTGQFAKQIADILPQAAILSFEPLDDCYQQLLEAMKEHPRFRAFNCALGEREESLVMHHNEFSAFSSILSMTDLHRSAFPKTSNAADETVNVRPLDSVL